MSPEHPRLEEEWRVEVKLDEEGHGRSLGDRLHKMKLDDEARARLGNSVIVTRDGPRLFIYARHEQGAREAERVVREQLEQDGLAAEVQLTRWHPVEDAWRPAEEPLPETEEEVAAERQRHEEAEKREAAETGEYDWEVVVHLPDRGAAAEFAERLRGEGWPVKRRWRYVQVGMPTEEEAIGLGKKLEGEVPEGSAVGIRANPNDVPIPAFVKIGAMKPGAMRDLGL
ncbi:MAG: hypothetical protein ACXWW8_01210 [Solirubrobacterales bacterium]